MGKEKTQKMQPRMSLGVKTLALFAMAVALILGLALGTSWWRMGKLIEGLTYQAALREAQMARRLLGWPIRDWSAANQKLAALWQGQNPDLTAPELITLEQSQDDEFLADWAKHLKESATTGESVEFRAIPSSEGLREYALAVRSPSEPTIEGTPEHPGQLQGFILVSLREYGRWGNFLTVIWIATMAGVLAMLLFQLIAQRMFLRPVKKLRRTAEKVAKGNIEVRSHIRTGDEFEELSDAFNSMLARLSDAREQLQAINRSLDVKLEEISRANVALSAANRLKSEFIANVSHELRTPLNSIIGFAELLSEAAISQKDEKGGKYAENILRSGRALLENINDLLDLAKMEAGKTVMHIEKTSLTGICEDLVRLTAPLTAKKELQVQPQIDNKVPLLETDAGKLQQILYNLLSNSIKFTPRGGGIRIEADMATEDLVAISVIDNGPGISKEDQEHIFDKFTQVDPSTTREHGGVGLGLAIAKELAVLLGGELSVTSELGQGSAFTLTIPKVLKPKKTSPKPG
ncbi:MAG: HAMP domain-containing protein [Actinobacteria bacterium]|nr:HAMP domain-containing protein [Actinomycetota bacterium]